MIVRREKPCKTCGSRDYNIGVSKAGNKYSNCRPCGSRRVKKFYAKPENFRGRQLWNKNNPGKALMNYARRRSREENIEFTLEIVLIPEFCPILGIALHVGNRKSLENSPSLDRVNPARGYTPENTRVISHKANRLKNNGTAEEHRRIADYIDKNMVP